jgi:hypothetical protein
MEKTRKQEYSVFHKDGFHKIILKYKTFYRGFIKCNFNKCFNTCIFFIDSFVTLINDLIKMKINLIRLLAIPAMIVFAESQAQTVTQVKNRE